MGGEIVLRPTPEKTLIAEVRGDYEGLLDFVCAKSKLSLVAGARFETKRVKIPLKSED